MDNEYSLQLMRTFDLDVVDEFECILYNMQSGNWEVEGPLAHNQTSQEIGDLCDEQ